MVFKVLLLGTRKKILNKKESGLKIFLKNMVFMLYFFILWSNDFSFDIKTDSYNQGTGVAQSVKPPDSWFRLR